MQQIIREDIEYICNEELPWDKLRHKKILITGANGFLGSYIVFSLLECNNKYGTDMMIYALCRNQEKAYKRFKDFLHDEHLQFIFQDVCEYIEDIYKSDIIVHTASPANPYIIQQQPYEVVSANVIAYSKLLEKAQIWGTKDIVMFSSSAVYGYSTPQDGADESYRESIDFTNYKDVYCLSKQMCEMMTVCYEKKHDVNIKLIRPFVVYGPGDDLSSNKGIIDFLNDCIRDRNIVLKSSGETVRSYIYISDAIRAFFFILLKGVNEPYNISSDNNIFSIKQMAELICECNKNIAIEYKIENAEYLKNRSNIMIGKNDKLKKLGWSEGINIKEGIMRTYIWARESLSKREGQE